MRATFHEKLGECEGLIVETAGLVVQQIERTMRTLSTRDEAIADVVISGDDAVDERYLELMDRVHQLLATQAPVAKDLRLVTAMLHSNLHLERMADLCTNIAKFVKLAPDEPFSEPIMSDILEMGRQASAMLETTVQAFSDRDLAKALSLPMMDETIDKLNRKLLKQLAQQFAGDEEEVEWAMRMVLVSRQLERLGDHSVDIAEQVAFMITGEFREFTSAT